MRNWLTFLVLVFVAASPLHAAEEGGGLLTVDGGLMVWTLIIFGLLFVILRSAAWPKLLAAVEARERAIEQQLADARKAQDEAERLLDEHKKMLDQAHADANELLGKAKTAAEKEREELLSQTRVEQEEMLDRARREIGSERDRAVAELRKEAVDLSLAAASRVLEESVDSEQNRRLVDDYLRSLSNR